QAAGQPRYLRSTNREAWCASGSKTFWRPPRICVPANIGEVMELKIGRDTLLAIAAVAWADGTIEPREADALRLAAKQLEVQGQDLADVERSLVSSISLDEVETVRMSRLTRLYTYATCCWMAEVDGKATPA